MSEAAEAKIDNGGPAFPMSADMYFSSSANIFGGMSLRDYFAAKAMQGLLSQHVTRAEDPAVERDGTEGFEPVYVSPFRSRQGDDDAAFIARDAYAIADALIERRRNPSDV